MNCKPGDLAVIVRDEPPYADLGKFVNVKRVGEPDHEGIAWVCDSATGTPLTYWTADNQPRWDVVDIEIPDAWLRPIRPGDISDKEVSDLYAPKLPEVAHV